MLSFKICGLGMARNLFSQSRSTLELAEVNPYKGSSSLAPEAGNKNARQNSMDRNVRFIRNAPKCVGKQPMIVNEWAQIKVDETHPLSVRLTCRRRQRVLLERRGSSCHRRDCQGRWGRAATRGHGKRPVPLPDYRPNKVFRISCRLSSPWPWRTRTQI